MAEIKPMVNSLCDVFIKTTVNKRKVGDPQLIMK